MCVPLLWLCIEYRGQKTTSPSNWATAHEGQSLSKVDQGGHSPVPVQMSVSGSEPGQNTCGVSSVTVAPSDWTKV